MLKELFGRVLKGTPEFETTIPPIIINPRPGDKEVIRRHLCRIRACRFQAGVLSDRGDNVDSYLKEIRRRSFQLEMANIMVPSNMDDLDDMIKELED